MLESFNRADAPSPEDILLAAPIPTMPADKEHEMAETAKTYEFDSAQKAWEHIIKKARESTLHDWTRNGLLGDALNIWTANMMNASSGRIPALLPVKTYADYVSGQCGYDTALRDYILDKSNKTAVQRIDQIGRDFNDNLERIKIKNDTAYALSIARDAYRALREKEPNF